MDNRPLATSSYKEALKLDVYCFEAFDLLTSHHMLTAQEGKVDPLKGCGFVCLFSVAVIQVQYSAFIFEILHDTICLNKICSFLH